MTGPGLDGADVVLVGAFDYSYPREKSLRDGFERAGARVHEARYGDSMTFPGLRKLLLLPFVLWRLRRGLAAARERADGVDLVVVTKFNPLLLPFAAFYARRLDAVLVYDLFVSLHRTAEMRGMARPLVKATYLLERATYALPDRHLVGTDQLADLYADMYAIPRERFVRIPPGADEDRFHPRELEKRDTFTALYWGNFLPHHGVDVIVDAAEALRDDADVAFVFLGTGPKRVPAECRAEELGLPNVSFEGYVPDETLQRWIAESHVGLGVFSDDPRALASVTNKVCESVASGKATITEDSPAIREWFTHGEDIYTVPPEDGDALAEAVRELRDDPALVDRLEAGGLAVHEREFSAERIAGLLTAAFAPTGKDAQTGEDA